MKIFNSEFPMRTHSCQYNNSETHHVDPYVNLYITMNDICQANCKFCLFRNTNKGKFDYNKLLEVFEELYKNNITINKINFTGGEPSIELELMEKIVSLVKDDSIYLTINTNGYKLKEMINSSLFYRMNCFALSRHHYKDELNQEIFQTKNIPTIEDLKNFPEKRKLHLRCNLIKGYIDSLYEIQNYIDEMSKIDCFDFGFVSLMKLNDYCKENFINHELLDIEQVRRTRVLYSQRRPGICNCKNYIYYDHHGLPIKMYSRFNENTDICDNTLVYDINKLRIGFSGAYIH